MDLSYLSASNGVGEPVRATVTVLRAIGSTVLSVDSLTNWPQKFICTTGKLLSNGTLDPTTINVFQGHISGVQIAIDTFAPGYSDKGNSVGDICVIKPTTEWADGVASAAQQMQTFTQTQGDWRSIATVPVINSTDGQRQYTLKYPNTDLTTSIAPGTRLKVPRTTTPPTQSMSFSSASNQYATKASPVGFTFTTAYTYEACIYVNSLPTSGFATIASRYDGTNGSLLALDSNGKLALYANGTTSQLSYQSVPINRWVHVAATFSSGTFVLYIDGVAVPGAKTGSGTSITQAGSLQVGAFNSTNPFNGRISEVRIWAAAQTQAQILNNMNISLTGSETNLVALFQGNGDFNDKTANANNLTSTNGATFVTSNPKNATEYAVVTQVVKSGIDSILTVFCPAGYSIPNETLGTSSYSVLDKPFGFPTPGDKWSIITSFIGQGSSGTVTGSIAGSWGAMANTDIQLPIGEWKRKSQMAITGQSTTVSTFTLQTQWDTAAPTVDREGQHRARADSGSGYLVQSHRHIENVTSTSLSTVHKLYCVITSGGGTQNAYFETATRSWISHACAYV